jgi:hypothetical protein
MTLTFFIKKNFLKTHLDAFFQVPKDYLINILHFWAVGTLF